MPRPHQEIKYARGSLLIRLKALLESGENVQLMTDCNETLNETRSLLRPNLIRRLKVIIRGLLSPVLGFSLSKNWEAATAKSLGYESKSTLNSLKSGYRPGSTDVNPRAEVVVKHIQELISQIPTNRDVRVLDVGGGFGQYFLIQPAQ
jgi:hypothetical protein